MNYSLFTSSFLYSVLPDIAGAVVLSFCGYRIGRALFDSKRKSDHPEGADPEGGTSVIEFVLVLPLLLTLLMMVFQIGLIVQAKFIVNYAAFCAVRSAIVTIPARITSSQNGRTEEPNQLSSLSDPDSPKIAIIRRSAALPCVAISPLVSFHLAEVTGENLLPDPAEEFALGEVAVLFPATWRGSTISGQIVTRGPYAYHRENTKIEVITGGESQQQSGQQGDQQQGAEFADHSIVTVRVTYKYYLTVPIANRLLGTRYWGWFFFGSSGYYLPIVEQYSLPNEGEKIFPNCDDPYPCTPETEKWN